MMGAGLAKAAFSAANTLRVREHAPVRLFVYMAIIAVDADPHPSFYGGREALAFALGAPRDDAGYRSVKKAVRALSKHGLIDLRERPGRGRRARYNLLDGHGDPLRIGDPSGQPEAAELRPLGTPEGAVNNSHWGPLRAGLGTPEGPIGDPSGVPLGGEEKEEETRASAPTRSCRRHPSWEHTEPCRACAVDRRAAEAQSASRAPSTMSEQRSNCGPGNHRRMLDGSCLFCTDRDPLADIA